MRFPGFQKCTGITRENEGSTPSGRVIKRDPGSRGDAATLHLCQRLFSSESPTPLEAVRGGDSRRAETCRPSRQAALSSRSPRQRELPGGGLAHGGPRAEAGSGDGPRQCVR